MPFKSQAQRRKFYELERSGKISKATLQRWEDETPKKKLPERVMKKHSAAFNRKMQLALAATGGDTEKVAEAYEDELEKIAFNIGGLLRTGRSMFGAAPSAIASRRLAEGVGATGQQIAAKRLAATTGVKVAPTPGGGQLVGDALEKAKREFASRPRPGAPRPQAGRNTSGMTGQDIARTRLQETTGVRPPTPDASSGVTKAGPTAPTPAPAGAGGVPAAQAPGADGAAGIMEQITGGTKKHLGVDLQGGMGQFGDKGMAEWFSKLTPEQRANMKMTGGIGAAAGLAGAAGYGMGGGNTTVVHT